MSDRPHYVADCRGSCDNCGESVQEHLGDDLRCPVRAVPRTAIDPDAVELPDSDPRKWLNWALEMMRMYERRLIEKGDPEELVYADIHRECLHLAALAATREAGSREEAAPASAGTPDAREIATRQLLRRLRVLLPGHGNRDALDSWELTPGAEKIVAELRVALAAPSPSAGSERDEREIERLARFIMEEIPGEPSQSEGAVDTAIRLLRRAAAPAAGEPDAAERARYGNRPECATENRWWAMRARAGRPPEEGESRE